MGKPLRLDWIQAQMRKQQGGCRINPGKAQGTAMQIERQSRDRASDHGRGKVNVSHRELAARDGDCIGDRAA